MAIPDQVVQANANTAGTSIQSGINQSAQTFGDLAARGQQLSIAQDQLKISQQEQDQRKDQYIIGTVQKGMESDDPAMQKMYLDHAQTMGQKWGRPINDDIYDLAKNSQQFQQQSLGAIRGLNGMDPADRAMMAKKIMGAFGLDGPASVDAMTKFNAPQEDIVKAQVQANALTNRMGYGADLKTNKDLLDNAIKAGVPSTITDRMKSNDPTAYSEALPYISQYNQKLANDKSSVVDSQNKRRAAQTDQGQQRIDLAGNLGQQRVDATKQALALRGKQLSLGQERLLNQQEDKIDNNPSVQAGVKGQQFGVNAMAVLNKPKPTWIDLNDVIGQYTRELTQYRPTFGAEQKKSFDSLASYADTLAGKVENSEVGGPNEKELQLWKTRLGNLNDNIAMQHDQVYSRYWRSKAATGVVDPGIAGTHFNENRLSDSVQWQAPKVTTPGSPAPAPGPRVNAQPSAQSASLKQPTPAFVQALKARYNDSGIVKGILQKNGYDPSGVQ